ncbi:MAG: hypothetical protein OEU36_22135, partial [Gammaproteobacteria bacterium]|nr:hypothetical protein [Gammaproteobacteria bacterium]
MASTIQAHPTRCHTAGWLDYHVSLIEIAHSCTAAIGRFGFFTGCRRHPMAAIPRTGAGRAAHPGRPFL